MPPPAPAPAPPPGRTAPPAPRAPAAPRAPHAPHAPRSEGPPDPHVDSERVRAALREHPAQTVRLVVLEDDDLIAGGGRAQRAREREEGAVGQSFAENEARRRRQRVGRGS